MGPDTEKHDFPTPTVRAEPDAISDGDSGWPDLVPNLVVL